MDKIEVSQRARDFTADYLQKNGQIAGSSTEDIKAGEWDETRHLMDVARFERDILATRTDATPVAWMPIESAPKDGTPLLLFARSRYATASVRVVGWYIEEFGWIECAFGRNKPVGLVPTRWQHLPAFPDHIEEPRDMVHATDVAALVEALRFYAGLLSFPYNAWVQPSVVDYSKGGDGHHPDGPPIPSDTLLLDGGKHARQALAPFTKGQP